MYAGCAPVSHHLSGPLIYLWFKSIFSPFSFFVDTLILRKPLLLQSGRRMELIWLHQHLISRCASLLHSRIKFGLRLLVYFGLVLLLPLIMHSIFTIETQILELVVDQSNMPIAEIEFLTINQVLNDGELLHQMRFSVNTTLYLSKILVQ